MKNPITVYDAYDRFADPINLGQKEDYCIYEIGSTREEAIETALNKLREDYCFYDIVQRKKESIKIENGIVSICYKVYSIFIEIDEILYCLRNSKTYANVNLIESQEYWVKLCTEEELKVSEENS